MITYNSPEHAKERQNVFPLTKTDTINVVSDLNTLIAFASRYVSIALLPEQVEQIQRLVDHHANLQHFHDVVGGWEGLESKQDSAYDKGVKDGFIDGSQSKWISINVMLPEEDKVVSVYELRHGEHSFGTGYIDDGVWECKSVQWLTLNPTHWQPLPEPPTE